MPKSETSLKELLHEVRRVAKSREVLTEKRIRRIYRDVMKDLNGYLADAYVKYSDEEGRLTLSQLKNKTSYARFLEEVAERVDTISPALRREMLNLADDVYSRSWRSMTDAVQNAADLTPYRDILGDSIVRPEVMRQAVKNNISKLTLPPLLERNRQDVIYQIQQVLGIGLMNGDRYDTMAKKITERLDVSYSKAVLTARTESHRNQEAGMLDCAKEISNGVEGSGLIYTATWRTMQDERVRPNHRYHTKSGWKTVRSGKADHQKMEGKIIRVGDRFDLGDGVFAEAPGSSGVAAHDCNCRCYLEYALMTPEEFVAAGGKFDKKEFTNADDSDIISIDGILYGKPVPRDVGAKSPEHPIVYYPETDIQLQFVPGSRPIYPPDHTMAGYGCKTHREIDDIDRLVHQYKCSADRWQKEKARYEVYDEYGEIRTVELHWYQHPDTGKVEYKVKTKGGYVYVDEWS